MLDDDDITPPVQFGKKPSDPLDSDFDEVNTPSMGTWKTSPEMLDDLELRGICINAPGSVDLNREEPRIVICGACHFDVGFLDLPGSFPGQIKVIAVNVDTHEPYVAPFFMGEGDIEPDPDPGPMLIGASLVEYFNLDVIEYGGLPLKPANYLIYAVLADHVSNVVRVSLRAGP